MQISEIKDEIISFQDKLEDLYMQEFTPLEKKAAWEVISMLDKLTDTIDMENLPVMKHDLKRAQRAKSCDINSNIDNKIETDDDKLDKLCSGITEDDLTKSCQDPFGNDKLSDTIEKAKGIKDGDDKALIESSFKDITFNELHEMLLSTKKPLLECIKKLIK